MLVRAALFWLLMALVGLLMAPSFPTGLDRPFPEPLAAPAPPDRVQLGRWLFFDPVLSRDGSLSCAHCHRPERAFSDGRARARGRDGSALARNTPTLYNVVFKQRLMWDGRAESLEAQVLLPLTAQNELGSDPELLLSRLRALPDYVEAFEKAFPRDGGESVSLNRLAQALAAFERSLISRDSRYDRYARGERSALGPAERRGLTVFRSVNTRCFECHRLPTFEAPLLMGIGVPSEDPGAGGVLGVPALDGAFVVPTLRNVALTAPYMHDGSIATLDEVVDFYRTGGGRTRGVPAARIHEHVRPFDIGDRDAGDLVAFLHALSDESGRPEVPESVPSGLPVLEPDS